MVIFLEECQQQQQLLFFRLECPGAQCGTSSHGRCPRHRKQSPSPQSLYDLDEKQIRKCGELGLIKSTLDRLAMLRLNNYKVVFCWECEWVNVRKREMEHIAKPLEELASNFWPNGVNLIAPNFFTDEEIRDHIATGELEGLICCALKVPESHYEECLELCPLFKQVDISMEDVETALDPRIRRYYPHLDANDRANVWMRDYCSKYGHFGANQNRKHRQLVSCLSNSLPQFYTSAYLRYLISRFDVEMTDVSKLKKDGGKREGKVKKKYTPSSYIFFHFQFPKKS